MMPSDRQQQILRLKAQGKDRPTISQELGVSLPIVDKEVYAACCVLGVENVVAAVAIGITEGWLTL